MFVYEHIMFKRVYLQSMLKSSLIFKENTNFMGNSNENSKDYKCEIFRVLFSYQPKHLVKLQNLH